MSHSPADPQPAQLVDTPDDHREREHDEEGLGRRSRHTEDIAKRRNVQQRRGEDDLERDAPDQELVREDSDRSQRCAVGSRRPSPCRSDRPRCRRRSWSSPAAKRGAAVRRRRSRRPDASPRAAGRRRRRPSPERPTSSLAPATLWSSIDRCTMPWPAGRGARSIRPGSAGSLPSASAGSVSVPRSMARICRTVSGRGSLRRRGRSTGTGRPRASRGRRRRG